CLHAACAAGRSATWSAGGSDHGPVIDRQHTGFTRLFKAPFNDLTQPVILCLRRGVRGLCLSVFFLLFIRIFIRGGIVMLAGMSRLRRRRRRSGLSERVGVALGRGFAIVVVVALLALIALLVLSVRVFL